MNCITGGSCRINICQLWEIAPFQSLVASARVTLYPSFRKARASFCARRLLARYPLVSQFG